MSAESQDLFHEILYTYQRGNDPASLKAAAAQHLACTRSVAELTALYARALDSGDQGLAQAIAEELAPVRAAERVMAGVLPGTGG